MSIPLNDRCAAITGMDPQHPTRSVRPCKAPSNQRISGVKLCHVHARIVKQGRVVQIRHGLYFDDWVLYGPEGAKQ